MVSKKILAGLAGIISSFFIHSAYANPAASNQLTQLLQNLKTFSADFNQVIQDKNGNTIQESHGKMALQRPGRFRWNTLKPNQQLIVADGKTIWIYDKDLQEVTKKKQTEDTQSPALLLSDSVDHLAQRFNVSSLSTNDFELTPVRSDLFKSVELVFNKKGTLTNMTLNDNLGQHTQIQFTHAFANTSLPSTLFTFHPPKDADVVQG